MSALNVIFWNVQRAGKGEGGFDLQSSIEVLIDKAGVKPDLIVFCELDSNFTLAYNNEKSAKYKCVEPRISKDDDNYKRSSTLRFGTYVPQDAKKPLLSLIETQNNWRPVLYVNIKDRQLLFAHCQSITLSSKIQAEELHTANHKCIKNKRNPTAIIGDLNVDADDVVRMGKFYKKLEELDSPLLRWVAAKPDKDSKLKNKMRGKNMLKSQLDWVLYNEEVEEFRPEVELIDINFEDVYKWHPKKDPDWKAGDAQTPKASDHYAILVKLGRGIKVDKEEGREEEEEEEEKGRRRRKR